MLLLFPPLTACHSDNHITGMMQLPEGIYVIQCSSHFVALFPLSSTSYNNLSLTSHNPPHRRFLIVGKAAHPLFEMSPILIATSEANPNCEGVQSVTL